MPETTVSSWHEGQPATLLAALPLDMPHPRSWLLSLSEISTPRNAFLLPRLLFFSLHFQLRLALRLGLRLFLLVPIVKPTRPQAEMIKQPVDDLYLAERCRLPPQIIQPLYHRNVVDRLLARFDQPTRAALSQRSQNVRFCHGTFLSVPNRVPHPQCQCQCQVPSSATSRVLGRLHRRPRRQPLDLTRPLVML